MVTGVAGCRMVTVCPGTPGAIWLATVWMTLLAVGMVAKAMVGFSSKPLASLPRSSTAVPAASWAPPAEVWLARMYPLAELAEEVTTLSMVTGGACCTTWIAWPEGGCAVTMEAGM